MIELLMLLQLAVFIFLIVMIYRAVKALEATAEHQRVTAERLTDIVRHLRQ